MDKLKLCGDWMRKTGREEAIEEDVHAVLLGPISNLYDCFYWRLTGPGRDFWENQWNEGKGKLSEEGIQWLNDYLDYHYPVTKAKELS